MRTLLLAAIALAAMTASPTHAQDLKSVAARVEIHPFQSLTLSDEGFLTGAQGTTVTLAGELRIAQGEGKRPTVVLMHGSGGIGSNIEPWTQRLNANGISTFVIDGFTGRGLTSTNTNQSQLGRLNFIIDIYRALETVAKHPRVDSQRIALMGFSRGGQAALYAGMVRFHQMWNKSGAAFKVYVPFYPDCSTSYIGDMDLVDAPVRVFHGTPDDYNPVANCRAYAARLVEAKRDIRITEYPDAAHAFDIVLGTGPVVAKGAQTVRNCQIKEEEAGRLVNISTGSTFSYKDQCVQLDPHVGPNPQAREAAYAAVIDLLREQLSP